MSLENSVWGACVAQSVKHPTLTQVMTSGFVGLSPVLCSMLTAQSLEPASDSVSPSLSAPPALSAPPPLYLPKIKNIKKLFKKFSEMVINLKILKHCEV